MTLFSPIDGSFDASGAFCGAGMGLGGLGQAGPRRSIRGRRSRRSQVRRPRPRWCLPHGKEHDCSSSHCSTNPSRVQAQRSRTGGVTGERLQFGACTAGPPHSRWWPCVGRPDALADRLARGVPRLKPLQSMRLCNNAGSGCRQSVAHWETWFLFGGGSGAGPTRGARSCGVTAG